MTELFCHSFVKLAAHGRLGRRDEITDRFGEPIRPREWFLLPLPIIEQAVPLIVDGSILRYRYDHRACAILDAKS
ncbi:hypothetical protein ACTMU2_30290 [Cupriavidus basilensis]